MNGLITSIECGILFFIICDIWNAYGILSASSTLTTLGGRILGACTNQELTVLCRRTKRIFTGWAITSGSSSSIRQLLIASAQETKAVRSSPFSASVLMKHILLISLEWWVSTFLGIHSQWRKERPNLIWTRCGTRSLHIALV